MANGGSRPIAPARKLIAAVLGTVATFVVLFGLGMTSWAIVALGVALVVLAIALATLRGGGRTWVVGVAHVHSASEPPTTYAFGRCELQIVIDAPGLPPRSKKIIEPRVPVSKWPSIGQSLPVRVALDDQRHVRVLWEEVPTHAESVTTVADLPPEYAGTDPLVEEMLVHQEAPPWAGRTPDDDYRDDYRDDLRGFHDDLRDPPPADPFRDDPGPLTESREPVVVHQRPGGPVVLEGTWKEPPASTLPRRATPAPRSPAEEQFEATVPIDTISGVDTPGPAVDPAAEPHADPAHPGTERHDAPTDDWHDGPDERPAAGPAHDRSSAGFVGEPIVDPVDVPLDDPVDMPLDDPAQRRGPTSAHDDLDETVFAYDPATQPADATAPISGVGITLLVTDLARSLDFYRDTLGFEEVDRGAGNAVLASGATRLVLREVTGAAPISRRLVHVNLEVDDIQGAYERMRDSGVRFTYAPRVVNRGTRLEGWAAAFRDPDGHGVALTQWRTRADA